MSSPAKNGASWRERLSGALRRASVIDLLRIGTGLVWVVNLIFIVDPQNRWWATFFQNALSYAPTTIGGPGFAQYVAGHPLFFSWAIAIVTGYLAVALTFGLTTRLACFVGSAFSAILLATQFGSTFVFPGGTDIGEHPLYILIYAAMVVGGAGTSLSLDEWVRDALATWRATPPAPARVPSRSPWSASVSTRTLFAYFAAGTLVSMGVGFGLVIALPAQSGTSTIPSPTGPVSYVNLTVNVNATNGWPQVQPGEFHHVHRANRLHHRRQ